MRTIKIHDAKTHFSALIHDVQGGEEILIARGDTLVAKLVPIESREGKRVLGYYDGQPVYIADDFDEYLPEEWREYTE
ncbi:MAG TPA: type II toxin-antitoxin system Phd/YefM family antitoxin [Verrucomicrobiae bacterium]|jgi:antitoxin (DNA-binding transcriptional repressor) of toxin-antitoxin stability system|nr:type II toxin-antitoxin system Phd/YefM family antitoxin [Verrucomicrobiae bacterium]